ncbi:FecR family protein [Zobellia russellii]|uniref:FecR family protein n=1 Tax=Zobellia russellii TaxID=248907 RepID=UPI001BFF4F40|nr:FecR family protein [Zobellia russellii]MBT9187599.1 FecR family protein [Zobellia russellii]
MTKKEFFSLLDKHENGTCSKKEKELLLEFCDKAQGKNKMDSWNLLETEQTRIRLLKNITTALKLSETRTINSKKISWRYLGAIAATFIGLIAIVYLFQKNNSLPNNMITLELEGGSLKVLDEHSTTKLFDEQGKLFGKQKKRQLVYYPSNSTSELAYNTLNVPNGKTFDILLSDSTIVHLNAGSSLKYPIKFLRGGERKIFLSGEAYLNVKKDSLRPFIVNTEELNIRVLGTQFNINAYPEDEVAEVVLIEGSVSLYQHEENFLEKGTLLTPGHKASFNKKQREFSKEKVLPDLYTSWMQNELVFRKMTFENILRKLERHYNVKISNDNLSISKEKFNANLGKNTPIEAVLQDLKITYNINYTISGNQINITE